MVHVRGRAYLAKKGNNNGTVRKLPSSQGPQSLLSRFRSVIFDEDLSDTLVLLRRLRSGNLELQDVSILAAFFVNVLVDFYCWTVSDVTVLTINSARGYVPSYSCGSINSSAVTMFSNIKTRPCSASPEDVPASMDIALTPISRPDAC